MRTKTLIACVWVILLTGLASAETFTITQPGTYNGQGRTVDSIVISNVTDVVVRNYNVEGTGQAGILVKSSQRLIIEDCLVSGFQHGIWVQGARDSIIRNNAITGCQIGFSINGWVLVEGNEVDGLALRGLGDADYARGWNGPSSGGPLVFRGNWFHGADVDMLEAAGSHVDGFQTFTVGGGQLHNFIFEGNVVQDFHEGMIAQDNGVRPSTKNVNWIIRDNVFARGKAWIATIENVNGVVFDDNYAVDITPQGLGIRFGSVATSIQRNIISIPTGIWSDPESDIEVVGSNIYFGTIRNRLGAVSTTIDPQVIQVSPGKYRFAETSPLRLTQYGPSFLKNGSELPEPTPTSTPNPTPQPTSTPTPTPTPIPTETPLPELPEPIDVEEVFRRLSRIDAASDRNKEDTEAIRGLMR